MISTAMGKHLKSMFKIFIVILRIKILRMFELFNYTFKNIYYKNEVADFKIIKTYVLYCNRKAR